MTNFEYKCECGQTTYFVDGNGTWKKDIAKHGNGSAVISCFNCSKKITIPKSELIEEPKMDPVVLPQDNIKPNKKQNRSK